MRVLSADTAAAVAAFLSFSRLLVDEAPYAVDAFSLRTNHCQLPRPRAAVAACTTAHRVCVVSGLAELYRPRSIFTRENSIDPLFLSSLSSSSSSDADGKEWTDDDLLVRTSDALRRSSWISWWAQVILTTVSAVILVFARNIALVSAQRFGGTVSRAGPGGGFVFAGSGIALSIMSVFWTWGGARLSRRILRGETTRISAANLMRRTIKVGASVNMLGMLVTLIGAFIIVGELATKVLTTQGFTPFGGGIATAAAATQTLQPLDILVVQGNFNTLLSHFSSLVFTLFVTRFVDRLDPPSTEDDPRD